MTFVTLSSAVVFAIEHRAKRIIVDGEVEAFRASQVASIAEGLWNLDDGILKAIADGIVNYPYFCRAAIDDGRGISVKSGEGAEGSEEIVIPIFKTLPVGGELRVGSLTLEIDSRRLLADVASQALPVVLLQVLLLAVQSFVVLFFFSRKVARHLSRIAAYIIKNDVRLGAPPLGLEKKYKDDELDFLVRAYNRMREDVAESRRSETRAMEDLVLSEERSRILVEEAPDAIMMFDADAGVFVDCNRRAEDLFGRSRAELIGTDPVRLYSDKTDDGLPIRESVARSHAAATAGEAVMVMRRVVRSDGEILDCEVRLNLLPSDGRRIIRLSYMDVTERVRAEEAIARSLREKEVLIQEVYHRTKNNMQLISAFLGLEAESSGEERVAAALRDMIGRISSMALVHQKLYMSKDLSRIDLGDYVSDLASSIACAYLEGRRGISVSVDIEPGIVSVIDVAVPCGLVLNELMVNSAKYAFAGRESGTISVSLRRVAASTLELSVSDDGVGLPELFDFRRDGHVGLQTVVSIVEMQMRGELTLGPGPGTSFTAAIRDDLFGPRL